jgi:adenine-specific DNA-methyltransferase
MRFLGNKESLIPEIYGLLERKGLVSKSLILYDAFCGSGAVSDALKSNFRVVAGDMLNWCVIYTSGRLCAGNCTFSDLGFDPFEYLNSTETTRKGFFYNTYSPGGSDRMYFTAENAGRIDFFRASIEEWYNEKKITDEEYHYLLASLIETVSDVSNTAGVYGAFLKKWDPRAVKPIIFHSVDFSAAVTLDSKLITGKVESVVETVECDVIYIDPPYTQNQYGTQYHIFETLVLNDEPSVSKVTGSRPVTPMRSGWSQEFKANILFDKIIANTKAKYIVFSYNSDGFLSKDFVLSSLKRYCKEESIEFIKIPYKKYRNFKTKSDDEHFEYLFFAEKKPANTVVYESPLNYIGSKSLLVPIIRELLPESIGSFIDLFGGGLNVGINVSAGSVTYNDINFFVKQIIESFRDTETYDYLLYIHRIIKKFGLEPGNREAYRKARDYYNSMPPNRRDPKLLFVVIMYGYQQQMRFNSKHEFNNPVGMRWFNDCVLEKMISFSRVLKKKSVVFESVDFRETAGDVGDNAFVYMDPPYRLTLGSYNDGKRGFDGWTCDHEKQLCAYADALNARGVSFMISYVLSYAGRNNVELKNWCDNRGYNVIEVDAVPRRRPRKEVLITNYENINF